jgi:hypothetical protein
MMFLSPLMAVGLFIYGWSAQYKLHWVVPILGTFFIGTGAYFVLVSVCQRAACVGNADEVFADAHAAISH